MFSRLEVITEVMVCEIEMLIAHQTSDTPINTAGTLATFTLCKVVRD